jgi:hypothetical protein
MFVLLTIRDAWRWYRRNRCNYRPAPTFAQGGVVTAAGMNRHVADGIKAGLLVAGDRRLAAQRYAICSDRARAATFIVDARGVTVIL